MAVVMMMGFEEEEEEKWVKHYSSNHQILVVGDGDFSFSLSLARSFGSASNIIPTSLDSYDVVIKKYKEAKSNLENLKMLGASPFLAVNATRMKTYPLLSMRKFDRIIFNFPHAGFHGKEDNIRVIHLHRSLVHGFFWNARSMLRPNGEIHVNHKTTPPFCQWKIEELAAWNSLALIECVDFNIEDYPGYNNKRGDGARCDQPFPLGECSTFKFQLSNTFNNMPRATSHFHPLYRRFEQFQVQNPSTSFDFNRSQMGPVTGFTQNSNQPLPRLTYPPSDHIRKTNLNFDCVEFRLETSFRNREDYHGTFPTQFGYQEEILERNHHGISPVNELRPGRTWNQDLLNRETITILPRRTSNHDMNRMPESSRRVYDMRSPVINELGHGFNRYNMTGRTLNHDMHMLPNFDRRTLSDEGFLGNGLGFVLDKDGTKMFPEFDRRTRHDASFPVNELRFGFDRDRMTVLPGRALTNDMHTLHEFGRTEMQRLVRE